MQDNVLPELKRQLSNATGLFKSKERKAITAQIEQTEKEISERLGAPPEILKDDGYPDASAFIKTYRKAEAIVEDYNRDLAEWERQVKEGKESAKKEKPPELASIRERLRQLQQQGKQQPHKKKSFDRESR